MMQFLVFKISRLEFDLSNSVCLILACIKAYFFIFRRYTALSSLGTHSCVCFVKTVPVTGIALLIK